MEEAATRGTGITLAERREIVKRANEAYFQFRQEVDVPLYWLREKWVGKPAYGAVYTRNGITVQENVLYGPKMEMWLHLRVSRKSRKPDWDELDMVRRDFVTDDRVCYQTFPADGNTLHLWTNLDSPEPRLLPDFRETADAEPAQTEGSTSSEQA